MAIQISKLTTTTGHELWFIGQDGKPFPGLYLDRDHAMDAARLLVADFDEQELDFESFDALPSDGFPPGFKPFRRKNKSAGIHCIVVLGPGGMLPLSFTSPEAAQGTCEDLAAKLSARLVRSHNPQTQSIATPKGG